MATPSGRSRTKAKKAGSEKRKQEKFNENEGRREVSSERGMGEEGSRAKEKKRDVVSEKEIRGLSLIHI